MQVDAIVPESGSRKMGLIPMFVSPLVRSVLARLRAACAFIPAGLSWIGFALFLLVCLAAQVGAVTITTTNGAGADAELTENPAGFDSGNGSGTPANAGYNPVSVSERNEYIALRFDLSGQPWTNISPASLELVNFRTNGAGRLLRFYGVATGTTGKNNNSVIRG